MALSSEQVYNSLTGEEVKQIFEIRFSELLGSIPHLQPHLTYPRVRMRIRIDAEISGESTPSSYFNVDNTLTVRSEDGDSSPITHVIDTEMEVDSLTTPVDQVRVEHGLPITELKRTPFGIQEDKVVVEGQTHSRRAAASITLDRGGPATAGYTPIEPVLKNNGPRQEVAPIKQDFSENILKKGGKQ